MNRCRLLLAFLSLTPLLTGLPGCSSGPISQLIFPHVERTTHRTPKLRIEEARQIAAQATGENSAEQLELSNDLAHRLAAEPDPLVREVVMQSIARFDTPTVGRVLLAGLGDSDPVVRQQCCRALGTRQQTDSITALRGVISDDEDRDVRHEAIRALGKIGSPEALQALSIPLQDHDPAMQLVAIEAARGATGTDLGNDAGAYLALVQGDETAIASRPDTKTGGLRGWLKFR